MKNLLVAIMALCVMPIYAGNVGTNTPKKSIENEINTNYSLQEVTKIQSSNNNEETFLSHLSVALRASTLGIGLQAATPINELFKLRAGLDFFSLSPGSWSIGLDDPDGAFDRAFGYTPDYDMKGNIKFINGNILVDFHPTKGIFHLTAGVFLGSNKIGAKGMLLGPDGKAATLKPGVTEWPHIDFDGQRLTLNDANLNADLRLGGIIKPYFGLGIGRAIAKNNRVSFKFELGMIYQGNFSLKQDGKSLDKVNNAVENFEDIDDYKKWLKWWPMLNFQLSYRIF